MSDDEVEDFGQEPMDDNMDGDGDLYAELEEARNQQKGVLDDEEEKEVKEKKDEDLLMDLGIVEMREDIMDDDLAMPEPLNVNSEIEPSERQPNAVRVTRPVLTKYERTKIIGTRATQLAMGAAPMVELDHGRQDPLILAEKELNEFKVPLVVRRYLPDGSFEDWSVAEFNTKVE